MNPFLKNLNSLDSPASHEAKLNTAAAAFKVMARDDFSPTTQSSHRVPARVNSKTGSTLRRMLGVASITRGPVIYSYVPVVTAAVAGMK